MGLNKRDYIKLHGEEAWPEEQARRRERGRAYYLKNREAIQAQHKEYREAHREEYDAYQKAYYEENKERLKKAASNYYKDNREKKLEYWSQYRENNWESILQSNKAYRDTPNGRSSYLCTGYKQMDTDRGFEKGNVNQKWVLKNIFGSKCIYCGDSDWKHLGCDRIDNSKPHNIDNIVCSCGICNVERASRDMTVSEFIEYRKNNPRTIDLKPELVEIEREDGTTFKALRKRTLLDK